MAYKSPNERLLANDMFSRVESVTPAMAHDWLSRNFANNRPLRIQTVRRLEQDMREGRWILTHQAIAFNRDGELIDGQHRLNAVFLSGATVPMLVSYNVPMEGVGLIDCGNRRSDADSLAVSGVHRADQVRVSTARMMYENGLLRRVMVSRSRFREFYMQHEDAIDFAVSATRGVPSLIGGAGVVAPIARAWYSQDRERLEAFAYHVRIGVAQSDNDNAALTLFRLVTSARHKLSQGSRGRVILYRKATAALAAFLEHRPCSRLYEMHPSPFAIPGDEERVDDDE